MAQTGWRQTTACMPMAGVPERLVLLTLAAVVAYVTLFVMQHSDPVPDLDLSGLIGSEPDTDRRCGFCYRRRHDRSSWAAHSLQRHRYTKRTQALESENAHNRAADLDSLENTIGAKRLFLTLWAYVAFILELHPYHQRRIKCDVFAVVAVRIAYHARASDRIVAAVMGMTMDPQRRSAILDDVGQVRRVGCVQ